MNSKVYYEDAFLRVIKRITFLSSASLMLIDKYTYIYSDVFDIQNVI